MSIFEHHRLCKLHSLAPAAVRQPCPYHPHDAAQLGALSRSPAAPIGWMPSGL